MAPSKRYGSITVLISALFSGCVHAASSDIFGPALAVSTRYWDCCKPSCAWANKASFQHDQPALSCDIHNQPLLDTTQGSGCYGGTAFACANNSPWAVNDTFSYGFGGVFVRGGDESTWCCGCYRLAFTDGPVKGKSMIIQATNTDYNSIKNNTFTIAVCSSHYPLGFIC